MGQSEPIGSKTILIVEDEALVRFDLADLFREAGWRVFEADNADQAIALLDARSDIRTVLTDVSMPGSMDGLRLAYHVRDRWPPTSLFVMSGYRPIPAEELPARCVFLAKPFDHHQLLQRVEAKAR